MSRWIRTLLALEAALVAGCGASGSAVRSSALEEARQRAQRAEQARAELARRSARQAERIRELEARLGLARAAVQDLRATRNGPAHEPTVRIGNEDDDGAKTNEGGTASRPRDGRNSARDAGGPNGHTSSGGSRPVLRLYGKRDGGGTDAGADQGPASAGEGATDSSRFSKPTPPPGLPTTLPVSPLPSRDEVRAASERTGSRETPETTPDARAASQDSPEVQVYRDALRHVRDRKFERALDGFAQFLSAHPQHPYADNARYWRGEVYYALRRYAQAAKEFTKVVEQHPSGNKVSDALLKLGLSYKRMGKLESAKSVFDRLRTKYPDSVAARIASREDAS